MRTNSQLRSIDDVIKQISTPERLANRVLRLPAPPLPDASGPRIALAVESMKNHTSDEGWQLMLALRSTGYSLCGHRLLHGTDVKSILNATNPGTIVIQDKREWDKGKDFREPQAFFNNIRVLRNYPAFKLTVLKDSHQKPSYHSDSAAEMGIHAWIIYYHPRIVNHLASFTRPQHLIRTYHSIDSSLVPEFNFNRRRCLLSGAVSSVYPLRERLIKGIAALPETDFLQHPGYHRKGTATPKFLQLLNKYKVSICTSSIFGYSLRKIFESVACGCIAITDLPYDDLLPEIEGGIVRVCHDSTPQEIGALIEHLYRTYDYEKQLDLANRAKAYYDYNATGFRLHNDIEFMRQNFVTNLANAHT